MESHARSIAEEHRLELRRCADVHRALEYLSEVQKGLIWFHVAERAHVVLVTTFLKQAKKYLAQGGVRVYVFSKFQQSDVVKSLTDHGASEVILESVSEKAIGYKMSRILPALIAHKPKPAREGAELSEAAREKGYETIAPLKIQSDFWLLRGGSARKVLGNWGVRLQGPGTNAGRWTAGAADDGKFAWIWTPTPAEGTRDPFVVEPGRWVFKGNRPEFQEVTWIFAGYPLELSFERAGHPAARKFYFERGLLYIAQDSPVALGFLGKIKESIDHIVRLAAEKQKAEEAVRIAKEAESARELKLRVTPDAARDINDRRGAENESGKPSVGESGGKTKASAKELGRPKSGSSAEATGGAGEDVGLSPGEAQEIRKKMEKLARVIDLMPHDRAKREEMNRKGEPVIHAISVAVLLSEWMSDPRKDPREVAHLFCSSVAAVFRRADVELWIPKSAGRVWKCAAKSHALPAQYKDQAVDGFSGCSESEGVFAGPVKGPGQRTLAVLVVKPAESARFSLQDIAAVTALARGLAITLAA